MYSTVVDVASANSAITVKQFTHSYNQPSVIASIPGTSTEVVVISAHYDSIGSTTSGRAPGADDNASVSLSLSPSPFDSIYQPSVGSDARIFSTSAATLKFRMRELIGIHT